MSRLDEIRQMHESGMSGRAVAQRLGVSASTVCHYLRRLGVPAQRQQRYDWAEVQRYYDAGNSITKCQQRFGMARKTLLCPNCHAQTDTWGGRNRGRPALRAV